MVTIQDIADYANVSKSTVSRVLNNSSVVNETTRAVVADAMDALAYEPNVVARSLAGGKSMTIGVMTQNIGSPFYDTIGEGIIKGLEETGYCPLFVDGQWDSAAELAAIRALLGRRVDGLILIGGDVPLERLNELKEQIPTIVVARQIEGWDDRCIFIDNYSAAYEATSHLIGLGHRDIAITCGIMEQRDAVRRYDGYAGALKDAGIELKPEIVHHGDFSAQSGVVAINSFLARGANFTAVFAANDMVAFGVRLALSRHSLRVPEDVSVVGFDDQPEAAYVTPPLTTVRQPTREMGHAAANAVLNLLNDEPIEIPDLRAELQFRESVSRLR